MQISDIEVTNVQKIIHSRQLVAEIVEIGLERSRAEDEQTVKEVTRAVISMPDREDRIAELKARIESGTYHVSGEDIADRMIRRNIADSLG